MLRRVARRRSMLLLGLLAVAVWLLLLIGDLHAYETPSDQDIAAARAQSAARVAAVDAARAECLARPDRRTDLPAESVCGVPLEPATQDLEQFLDDEPFLVARDIRDAPGWGAVATVPVALAAGLTWLGRQTATRHPRTEVAVLVAAAFALAVLGQLIALGRVGLLAWLAGPHPEAVDTDWSTHGLQGAVLGAQARAVWLTVTVAVCGLGLAWLTRGRVPILATVVLGWFVVQIGLSATLPAVAPWMPLVNADSLLSQTGTRIPIPDAPDGPAGSTYAYEAGHLHATLYYAGLTAVLLIAGLLRNARDLPVEREHPLGPDIATDARRGPASGAPPRDQRS